MTAATADSARDREAYQRTAEQTLARLGSRIDSLKARLDAAGERTKAEFREELAALELKREQAARKLDELKSAGAERWNGAKREMADELDSLDVRFDHMRARLRGKRS